MKYKIITGILTHNSEWIIDKMLKVASYFSEKIILLDDNSMDNTKEICLSYDKIEWNEIGKQNSIFDYKVMLRQKLIDLIKIYQTDYILLPDHDEIPSFKFLNFMENIDENIDLWTPIYVTLWGSENYYRVDKYRTSVGANVDWDPFTGGRKKGILMKYNKNIDYKYDITCKKGQHPAPCNVGLSHRFTDEFAIIHHGKLDPFFTSGEKHKIYAMWDEHIGIRSYEEGIKHHESCRLEGTPILKKIPEEWKWDNFNLKK